MLVLKQEAKGKTVPSSWWSPSSLWDDVQTLRSASTRVAAPHRFRGYHLQVMNAPPISQKPPPKPQPPFPQGLQRLRVCVHVCVYPLAIYDRRPGCVISKVTAAAVRDFWEAFLIARWRVWGSVSPRSSSSGRKKKIGQGNHLFLHRSWSLAEHRRRLR